MLIHVPFIWAEHSYPSDYWRIPAPQLDRLLSIAGFKKRAVETEPHRGMFQTATMILTFSEAKEGIWAPAINTFLYILALLLGALRWLDSLIRCEGIYTFVFGIGVKDEKALNKLDLKGLATLLLLWASRPDLKKAYPEVLSGNYSSLLRWAMTCGLTIDSAKEELIPYRSWLSKINGST